MRTTLGTETAQHQLKLGLTRKQNPQWVLPQGASGSHHALGSARQVPSRASAHSHVGLVGSRARIAREPRVTGRSLHDPSVAHRHRHAVTFSASRPPARARAIGRCAVPVRDALARGERLSLGGSSCHDPSQPATSCLTSASSSRPERRLRKRGASAAADAHHVRYITVDV